MENEGWGVDVAGNSNEELTSRIRRLEEMIRYLLGRNENLRAALKELGREEMDEDGQACTSGKGNKIERNDGDQGQQERDEDEGDA